MYRRLTCLVLILVIFSLLSQDAVALEVVDVVSSAVQNDANRLNLPDGKILFHWEYSGGSGFVRGVYSLNTDGTNFTQFRGRPDIGESGEIIPSPNAEYFVFESKGADKDDMKGGFYEYQDVSIYSWSRNEYASLTGKFERGDGFRYKINNDLYPPWYNAVAGAWSPDSTQFAYTDDDGIEIVTVDRSNTRRITADPGEYSIVAWMPDGSRLLYLSEGLDTQLIAITLDGSQQDVLLDSDFFVDSTLQSLSVDGASILYTTINTAQTSSIYLMDLATHQSKLLLKNSKLRPTNVRWSSTGQYITFSETRLDESTNTEIPLNTWIMHSDGTHLQQLLVGDRFAWSPDDTWIVLLKGYEAKDAYSGYASGGGDLYVMQPYVSQPIFFFQVNPKTYDGPIYNRPLNLKRYIMWIGVKTDRNAKPNICEITTKTVVNAREAPDYRSRILRNVEGGQKLEVNAKAFDSDGTVWYRLVIGGWILGDPNRILLGANCSLVATITQ